MYSAVASEGRQTEFSYFGNDAKCHDELVLLEQDCTVVSVQWYKVCWKVFREIYTLGATFAHCMCCHLICRSKSST